MILPLGVKKIKVDKAKLFKAAISFHTPAGAKDMEMRIITSTSSCCLKHNNTADIHLLPGPIVYYILEESMPPFHKLTQKMGTVIKPLPKLLWYCEYNMPILHPGKKSSAYIIYPLVCIYLCTGETKATFATEGNLF